MPIRLRAKLRNISGTLGPFKERPKFLANVILDWEDQDLGTTISAAGIYAYFRAANLTGESREKFKTDGTFETESGSSYYYIGLTAKF